MKQLMETKINGESQKNLNSSVNSISDDGSTVAFQSSSSNLGDNLIGGVQVWIDTNPDDPTSGLQLISRAGLSGAIGNRDSWGASLNSDGSKVSFTTASPNLVNNPNGNQVVVKDVDTGTIALVSHKNGDYVSGSSGGSQSSSMSDSDNVAYQADNVATNSILGDIGAQGVNIIYGYLVNGNYENKLVSHTYDDVNTPGNGDSSNPDASSDGRYITFSSTARDLVEDDTNGLCDIFLYDIATGIITRVNLNSAGQEANGYSEDSVVDTFDSTNGPVPIVIYNSAATNLVSGWDNLNNQVYVSGNLDAPVPVTTTTPITTSTNPSYSWGRIESTTNTDTNTNNQNNLPYNAQFMSSTMPPRVQPGSTFTAVITIKNTGSNSWTAGGIHIFLEPFGDSLNFGGVNIFIPDGLTIEPGQEYSFPLTLTAPTTSGNYNLQFRMSYQMPSVSSGNTGGVAFGDTINLGIVDSPDGKKTDSMKKSPESVLTTVTTVVADTTLPKWVPTPVTRPTPYQYKPTAFYK